MTDNQRSDTTKPVVRFAPFAHGYLHIGGARTALFNWLYAKGRDGRFLLRIEDTDRERNNPAAVAAILDGLRWLELDWEGEPVSQFARADRHREVANALLAKGSAYKCFLTTAELDAMRKRRKRKNGRSPFARPGATSPRASTRRSALHHPPQGPARWRNSGDDQCRAAS